MPLYELKIHAIGQDSASGPLDRVTGSLGRIAEFTVGGLLAGGIARIGTAIEGIGRDALNAVADYERLGMSLESLVAREIKNASGIEKMVAAGSTHLDLTKKQTAELKKLTEGMKDEIQAHDNLGARIKLQEQRINELTHAKKVNTLAVASAKQTLHEMQQKYADGTEEIAKHKSKISELNNVHNTLIPTLKKITGGQISMTDALSQAGPRAKELLGWIQKLAIQSPFKQEDVATALRLMMAYGFTTKEAQRLTQATIDFASGSGATADSMRMIGLALGQIKARGKLAGQEILQLVNAGIPVKQILAKAFGVTTAELEKMTEKGLVPADKAIEAITRSLEEDFGGAAQRQATTFSGLISSLQDIKNVGLREFFQGTFSAIQPYLIQFVDLFSSTETMTKIRGFGEGIGKAVGNALSELKKIFDAFQKGGLGAAIDVLSKDAIVALKRNWPAIEKQLKEWAPRVWKFLTEPLIKDAPTKIAKFTSELAAAIQSSWPQIEKQLLKWKDQFWDWLTDPSKGALARASRELDKFTDAIVKWSNSPSTQADLQKVGNRIGQALVSGLADYLQDPKNAKSAFDKFGVSLWNAAQGLATFLATIGGNIAGGIIGGIVGKFLGAEAERIVSQAVSETLTRVINIIIGPGGPGVQGGIAIANSISSGIQTGIASASGITTAIVNALNNALTAAQGIDWSALGRTIIGNLVGGVNSVANTLKDAIVWPFASAIWNILTTDWWGIGKGILETLAAGLEWVRDRVISAIQGPLQSLIDLIWALLHSIGIYSPSNMFSGVGMAGMLSPVLAAPAAAGGMAYTLAPSYNLTIYSQAQTEQVAADFMLMKTMAGAV